MSSGESVAMDDAATAAFLGAGGTGVLSLAKGDRPYATPVSYGFDPDEATFYLRLGVHEGGEKRAFIEASAEARLVVYAAVDDGWRSVVAVGPLEPVPDDALTVEVAAALRAADLPLLDIWEEPPADVEFGIYRLVAERLTGRAAPTPTEG